MISANLLVLIARFVEYSAAMILFGSPMFLLYGRPLAPDLATPDLAWTKQLLLWAAIGLSLATALGFVAQTTVMAGSFSAISDPVMLKAALVEMNFGLSSQVRLATALLVVVAASLIAPGKRLWSVCSGLGAVVCGSFAWMGHGAATHSDLGWVHCASDIAHLLAAAAWIGALAVFWIIVARSATSFAGQQALCGSLARFSGVGALLVAVIIASGVINCAFLVGWDPTRIIATRYGQVLIAKLFLFGAMLALATANRYQHTPHLAQTLLKSESTTTALLRLRKSIMLESTAAVGVLALVSLLGTLAPVAADGS